MPANREVEIKFRITDIPALRARLEASGFHSLTPRTHEMNSLYDLPDGVLRNHGIVLRIRQYGPKWTVTYKSKSSIATGHKTRDELETQVQDGRALAEIFEALGFQRSFAYEKFRSEFADNTGHVVIDKTPIGNFAEIEGPPEWIDQVAAQLGISPDQYITATYSELFLEWKQQTHSPATEMTFEAVRPSAGATPGS